VIQAERIQPLNAKPAGKGAYVLYWMQASQREECNHALEYAVRRANALKLPLVAVFGLTERYPEANERHVAFMLEGLRETQQALRRRGIRLVIRRQSPERAAIELARRAALLVTDRGYTRIQRAWRWHVARAVACRAVQVESDVVVPVELASDKSEYSAATLRAKIQRHLERFLAPLERSALVRGSLDGTWESLELDDVDAVLRRLRLDRGATRVTATTGGTSRARRLLEEFLGGKLVDYAAHGSDPGRDVQSRQSPYLHFGQISPLYIARRVRASSADETSRQAYLEQLIVRRELSMNFLRYNAGYASYRCLPSWARATLRAHAGDRRAAVYTLSRLERAETHDPYWNAAMREMVTAGTMHGYMRMYWCKKILEWTRSPAWAFRVAIRLNNKYFLDGRDPNAWHNVAWCFGLHDRPWGRRPIFGTVRTMSAAGLERKFRMGDYLKRVEALG